MAPIITDEMAPWFLIFLILVAMTMIRKASK